MKKPRKLPKFHYFNGKKYFFKWKKPYKCLGTCEDPAAPSEERFITIDPKQDTIELFDTILHEALHAELWDLSERAVTRISENITELMEKCGLIRED